MQSVELIKVQTRKAIKEKSSEIQTPEARKGSLLAFEVREAGLGMLRWQVKRLTSYDRPKISICPAYQPSRISPHAFNKTNPLHALR
jgi:hypothetical protein